jgi:uncharacterized protein (TIGR02145 family)
MAATSTWTTSSNTCAVGNTLATNNTTGFNIISSGFKQYSNGAWANRGTESYIWTSSSSGVNATYRGLFNGSAFFSDSATSKSGGYTVRCLKD